MNEGLNFIIFDDIVNAIDDDHRSGIADLLLLHTDLCDKQHILTCHADQFVNKLEHKLGTSKASTEVVRYRFCPLDSISARGIKISIGDPKHYLLQADAALNRDARKEAAGRCRQAVESIADSLWKKLGKERNISLSVKIRSPGTNPDVSTVVDSLIRELSGIDSKSEICQNLRLLKDKYSWSLLNKGTHEQDDLPEFERSEIVELVKLVNTLDAQVSSIKFTTSIVETAKT